VPSAGVHVPVYTDIDDAAFRREFQEAAESVWHARDDDEFRVERSISDADKLRQVIEVLVSRVQG